MVEFAQKGKFIHTGEEEIENGWTSPYLPSSDFTVSKEDDENTLRDGLVIKDSSGNEYVWIEVPKNSVNYGITTDPESLTDSNYQTIREKLIEYVSSETATQNYRKDNFFDYWYYWSASSTTYSKDPLTGTEYKNNATPLQEGDSMTSYLTDNNGTKTCGLTYSEYQTLYKAMLKSIYKNGGFYIGRYEAGMNEKSGWTAAYRTYANCYDASKNYIPLSNTENFKPISQKDAYPINFITCSDAQAISSRIAPAGYHSSLMFGIQWDLVLKYLEVSLTEKGESLTDSESNKNILTQDSGSWGNYLDRSFTIERGSYCYNPSANPPVWTVYSAEIPSAAASRVSKENNILTKTKDKVLLLTTGATERNSKQNIYDLAGNVSEWTLERASSRDNPCVSRGGDSYNYGSSTPASYRDYFNPINSGGYVGFRSALY